MVCALRGGQADDTVVVIPAIEVEGTGAGSGK